MSDAVDFDFDSDTPKPKRPHHSGRMRRTLNIQISESEHAWLKGFARHEGISMTQLLRDQIHDSMRRELALVGIEAGLRCWYQDCLARPAREGLCAPHAEARETRRTQDAERAAAATSEWPPKRGRKRVLPRRPRR